MCGAVLIAMSSVVQLDREGPSGSSVKSLVSLVDRLIALRVHAFLCFVSKPNYGQPIISSPRLPIP